MMLTTMAPKNAAPKPVMEMPAPSRFTDSQLASSSMRLLTTSWKMPSVRMVTGSEMMVTNGLMSALTKPRKRPVNAKLIQGATMPNGSMPGTMKAAIEMAIEVSSQLRTKRMGVPFGMSSGRRCRAAIMDA